MGVFDWGLIVGFGFIFLGFIMIIIALAVHMCKKDDSKFFRLIVTIATIGVILSISSLYVNLSDTYIDMENRIQGYENILGRN
jgi:hypothetical protein